MQNNSSIEPVRNEYLDQVREQQQRLEVDLKARKVMVPASQAQLVPRGRALAAAAPREIPGNAVDVRITGFWRWKTVVIVVFWPIRNCQSFASGVSRALNCLFCGKI